MNIYKIVMDEAEHDQPRQLIVSARQRSEAYKSAGIATTKGDTHYRAGKENLFIDNIKSIIEIGAYYSIRAELIATSRD